MKKILSGLALLSLSFAAPVSATAQSSLEGKWTNPKRNVVIDVDRCAGNSYCGKVVWASKKADDKVEGPLVGKQLMSGFRPDGRGGYRGRVYEPKRKLSGNATIRQEGSNTLVVKGCALAGLICKTQRWYRAG
ncbi:DUF2147 domain-containing protein [Sphingomonas piscis]|uniref:DUF2147 domain-containing protein n=1 Tax=Sphingomonas piscis TaxID=2714943 RepID=A0A6G7YQ20_9SPHN|nr:DUF2147 domain-containing protein [Sphingomonas piscis]QIK78834.1 DUF2147 domain-containing protein [Sphingomonas piscis]